VETKFLHCSNTDYKKLPQNQQKDAIFQTKTLRPQVPQRRMALSKAKQFQDLELDAHQLNCNRNRRENHRETTDFPAADGQKPTNPQQQLQRPIRAARQNL